MSSLLLTAPAVEPLSLAEAKAFLRVEHSDDDDVISALIAGSRIHIEAQTRRALVTQTWRIALDSWPADGRLPVRPAPLQEVTAVRVYDYQGNAQSLDLQAFVIDPGNSILAFAPWALAQPGRLAAGIEFDVVCGYGDAATDVPEPLRQAIRLLVVHWYENRGLAAVGTVTVPLGEDSERYEVDILSGASVVRTLGSATPSVLYPAADELVDFGAAQSSLDVRVVQLSATVGRGFAAEATVMP